MKHRVEVIEAMINDTLALQTQRRTDGRRDNSAWL